MYRENGYMGFDDGGGDTPAAREAERATDAALLETFVGLTLTGMDALLRHAPRLLGVRWSAEEWRSAIRAHIRIERSSACRPDPVCHIPLGADRAIRLWKDQPTGRVVAALAKRCQDGQQEGWLRCGTEFGVAALPGWTLGGRPPPTQPAAWMDAVEATPVAPATSPALSPPDPPTPPPATLDDLRARWGAR